MGTAVRIPEELDLMQREIAKRTFLLRKYNDDSQIYNPEFVNRVAEHADALEKFLRKECLENGNYIVVNDSGIRYTGQYLNFLNHDISILVYARIDNPNNITRTFNLWKDFEGYLLEEGKRDGVCLSILPKVWRAYNGISSKGDRTPDIAWEKCLQHIEYIKGIDLSKLDWVCSWWPALTDDEDVVWTVPEGAQLAGQYYFPAFLEFSKVRMDQFYDSEESVINMMKQWSDAIIEGRKLNLNLKFTAYAYEMSPLSPSSLERAIGLLWESNVITQLEKIELVTRLFTAMELTNPYVIKLLRKDSVDQLDDRLGRAVIDHVRQWVDKAFIQELYKPGAHVQINAMVKRLIDDQAFDFLFNLLKENFGVTESLVTLVGNSFGYFYENIFQIEHDELTLIVADCLSNMGMTNLANELMSTVQIESLRKNYPVVTEDLSYVLTKSIKRNLLNSVYIAHNKKEDQIEVIVDTINGESEKKLVEVKNYLGCFKVIGTEPFMVRANQDIGFVTVE